MDWWAAFQQTRSSTTSPGLKVYKPTTPGPAASAFHAVHACLALNNLPMRHPPPLSGVGFRGLKRGASLLLHAVCVAGFTGRVLTSREDLWRGRPYRPLTMGLRKSGGRNSSGRTTVWHRGGGSKRLYRFVRRLSLIFAYCSIVTCELRNKETDARAAVSTHLPGTRDAGRQL